MNVTEVVFTFVLDLLRFLKLFKAGLKNSMYEYEQTF